MVNTWELVSFEIRGNNDEAVYPFGRTARGLLIYAPSGSFSAQIMKDDRPKLKSDDPMQAAAEEIEASFKSVISYYGHYTFDEDENAILHHVEESLFVNWRGLTMKRFAKFENNILELSTEPTLWKGEIVSAKLIWSPR